MIIRVMDDHTELMSAGDRLRPAVHPHLAENIIIMPFHRILGDKQLSGNLPVRTSGTNKLQDF